MTYQNWRRDLRRAMVARRSMLSPAEHAELSGRIVAHLLDFPAQPRGAATVAFCWPIKNEPDVRAAIEHWQQLGCRAVLPVVVDVDRPLAFRMWTPATLLTPDRYGIPTPTEGEWLTPDIIVLPLNGFDSAGYRLGYGGGYFDRTLVALTPRPLAIGVGFEMNRVESVRPERHDQRLDWLVTENGGTRVT